VGFAFTVRVTDSRWLEYVDGVIHDQLFDVADITYADAEVVIPFTYEDHAGLEPLERDRRGKVKAARLPLLKAVLRITHVGHMHLRETEGLGTYDFNRLALDERRMVIDTNFPLEFWLDVAGLDVTAEVFADVVGSQVVRYGWAGESRRIADRKLNPARV
jgi:hypothetical protein